MGRPRSSSPTGSPLLTTSKLTKLPAALVASTVKSAGTIRMGPAAALAAIRHTNGRKQRKRGALNIVGPLQCVCTTYVGRDAKNRQRSKIVRVMLSREDGEASPIARP